MLTDLQTLILGFLINGDKVYGLDMVKRSDGKLKRGTVYVLLNRLEDEKLIRSKLVAPDKGNRGPKRRMYEITDGGRKAHSERFEQQAKLFGWGGAE